MTSFIKKSLVIIILLCFIVVYLIIYVHDKTEPIAACMKTGDYQGAYTIAVSTTLFDTYNYSRKSNTTLASYYMYEIDHIVKQDFNISEDYCLMAKELCNIEYLYKEAVAFYCEDDSMEHPAYGYEDNGTKSNYKARCIYSKKRLKEIEVLGNEAYSLPLYYWLPRFR